MPVFDLKRIAGIPDLALKLWFLPIANSLALMIFTGPVATAVLDCLGNSFLIPMPATASPTTDESRINPRRSSEMLLLRREP